VNLKFFRKLFYYLSYIFIYREINIKIFVLQLKCKWFRIHPICLLIHADRSGKDESIIIFFSDGVPIFTLVRVFLWVHLTN
jgi:hypothetical protein